VTPNYENYYYDFYDYYRSYTNDYLNAVETGNATANGSQQDNSLSAFSEKTGLQGTLSARGGGSTQVNDKYFAWKAKIDTQNGAASADAGARADRSIQQKYGEIQAFIFKNEGLK